MRAIGFAVPTTVGEAVQVLAEHAPRARMLAGGTDLIVQVREGQRDNDLFVDAKRIAELGEIAFDADGALTLGAAVSCRRIYADARLERRYPALADASRIIGGIGIQGRASVGGNLCNSGPAGDTIPALIAHGATCTIEGPSGRRSIRVEDFCTAPGRNVVDADELLVNLVFPPAAEGSGAAYLRFIPRDEMDIAVVGVGAALTLDGGLITAARVALGAVAPTPLFVPAAGAALVGSKAGPDAFERAAQIAQAACRPISDMRGTAEHRMQLVGVLVRRALERALARATEAQP